MGIEANTVKPQLTVTSQKRPPANNGNHRVLWENNITSRNSGPSELRSHFIIKKKKNRKKEGKIEKKGKK